MGRRKKQLEANGPPGAPDWMVTFSDCMTLLLTFFVLLLSFSSFSDQEDFFRLKVVFNKQFSVNTQETTVKEALISTKIIQQQEDIDKGSEKPTLDKGKEDNLKQETEPVDFHKQKVFLTSSPRIFWGKGTAISFQGRKTLSNMASFLKEVPNRIVITENGQENDKNSEYLGLKRAWAVLEYLTAKQGLDKNRFSLSAGTLQKDQELNQRYNSQEKPKRTLEIVLLERGIYN